MDYSTGFFLDDDELFTMFANDANPPLMKSRLFRLNVSNGIVELLGIKGNLLAIRKLTQPTQHVLVKLNSGSTIEVEGRLQELGFAPCSQSTREGFTEFQIVPAPPDGYSQQCDTIKVIWRSWWPIAAKTLNGRAAVLVFHQGNWLDVQKIETGAKSTIFTTDRHVVISTTTAIPWAIDTRFAKSQKVETHVKQSHIKDTDDLSWARETVLSGTVSTLSQTLNEIDLASTRWMKAIISIPTDPSGLLHESAAIEQRKQKLLKALEYLQAIARER